MTPDMETAYGSAMAALCKREKQRDKVQRRGGNYRDPGRPKPRDQYRDRVRELVAEGKTNTEMERELGISRSTIRTIREDIDDAT